MSTDLQRSAPEEQGIHSSSILAFVDAIEQQGHGLHSLMLLRHGKVVAEGWWNPYAADELHLLFSLSKSFTSTAIGLAVQEGRLSVQDKVISFFPEDCPEKISENLAAIRVHDLLTMASGQVQEPTSAMLNAHGGNWVRAVLAHPVETAPGTKFVYSSAATYLLSAIVQKLTGMNLIDYLTPRLLAPLGIEGVTWEKCPRGICTGGWGMSVKTEHIARFGQLYLQRGRWNGRQLLAESWIDAATRKQISNGDDPNSDWTQGYGYQFWRCRHGIYRGDGAFGQYCVVMPEQDAVLAMTGGVSDMAGVLNCAWQHLLPAMKSVALPADASGSASLRQRLANLNIREVQGAKCSPLAERISGKAFIFEQNDLKITKVRLEAAGERCRLVFHDASGETAIDLGHGKWIKSHAPFRGHALQPAQNLPAAGSFAWTADDTWTGKLYFYRTPASQNLTCKFEADQLTLTITQDHCFGTNQWPALVGRMS